MAVVESVEETLSKIPEIQDIAGTSFTAERLDELGTSGLHPAFSRKFPRKTKVAFLTKLLPKGRSNGRTLTARLMIQTLQVADGLDTDDMRYLWHSGLLRANKLHTIADAELIQHRNRWRMLIIRQFQRYILEEFLRCFELAILSGCRTLDEITERALRETSNRRTTALRAIFLKEAMPVSQSRDARVVAERWMALVDSGHPSYIDGITLADDDEGECSPALRMLARWWYGSMVPIFEDGNAELATLGNEDRISMRWFHRWVETRLDVSLVQFVRDVFEHLIFSQHVRIALSRFDGESQRMRFVLGDDGIVPTRSMAEKLATGVPGWMVDRLGAFANLLCDLSVLRSNDQGQLSLGPLAELVANV
jgi:hypothetical protein